ncbi:MAG: hypothetical protein HY655_09160 [Acidobacteria bacterium]|nr:hypothetical protein [Acidobacteriota bacterium]
MHLAQQQGGRLERREVAERAREADSKMLGRDRRHLRVAAQSERRGDVDRIALGPLACVDRPQAESPDQPGNEFRLVGRMKTWRRRARFPEARSGAALSRGAPGNAQPPS